MNQGVVRRQSLFFTNMSLFLLSPLGSLRTASFASSHLENSTSTAGEGGSWAGTRPARTPPGRLLTAVSHGDKGLRSGAGG